jgi:hypothetical protein
MRNTADVTGGKPIAILLLSISGVSAINSFVAFYDLFYEYYIIINYLILPFYVTGQDCYSVDW